MNQNENWPKQSVDSSRFSIVSHEKFLAGQQFEDKKLNGPLYSPSLRNGCVLNLCFRMDFANEMHCEFSKVSQDLVIGSVNEKAFVSAVFSYCPQ